jgi:pimeloyl-ACP methyl ester carboxylesterase
MKLKINGTTLNVFEAGVENYNKTRPTLVFLHYFGGSSQSWQEVIENLVADFHCVAPDMRGFGASDSMPENFAVKDYADDVAELISVLTIENYALVGHSMGGKIALSFAARLPRGLRSLILLAPSPPTPEPMQETEREKLLNARGNRCVAAKTICKAAGGRLSAEVFARAIDDNLRSSEAAWRAWLEQGSREDISAEIEKINVPILIAAGEADENITADLLTREIVRRVSDARLTVVEKAKHLLPLEVPDRIADLIRDEIEKISSEEQKANRAGSEIF